MTNDQDDLGHLARRLFNRDETPAEPEGTRPTGNVVPAEGGNGRPDRKDDLHDFAADLFGWPPSTS